MLRIPKLKVQSRKDTGTSAARRLRRAGLIPGALIMEGGSVIPISLVRHELDMILRGHASSTMIFDVELDGNSPKRFMLKELQRDTIRGKIIHVDFQEIVATKKIRIKIPIRLTGDPIGVTQGGGILDHHLREVEVECLPSSLMEEIVVDVSGLGVGESISVGDLKVDPGITILTDPQISVASVIMPRIEEEVPAQAATAVQAEPEVIAKGKKVEEEEAEAKEKAPAEEGKKAPAKESKESATSGGKTPSSGAKQ
jgi:large subunit ribosomal protein L25